MTQTLSLSGLGPAFLAVTLLMLSTITGCARATTPSGDPIDGQTHWLATCKSKADCGSLDCICGICSSACAADDTCTTLNKDAVCRSAKTLSTASKCTASAKQSSVCVSSVLVDESTASAVDATAAADATTAADGGSDAAATQALADASVTAAGPKLDCAGLMAGAVPAGLELLDTFDGLGSLTADDTSVYGTRIPGPASSATIWRFSEPTGPTQALGTQGGTGVGAQVLTPAVGELFFATSDGTGVVVAEVTLADGTSLNLGLAATFPNVSSIAVDASQVYWMADDGGGSAGTAHLMRSDRTPGATAMLASLPGQPVPGSLQLLGNTLYFAMYEMPSASALQMQLYRMAKGSSTPTAFGPPSGISILVSDGTNLYATLIAMRDQLGNPKGPTGVARVNLQDGTMKLLFTQPKPSFGGLAVDATDLYWVSGADGADTQVWRGHKDASGQPMNLARGFAGINGLTQTKKAVYWGIPCGTTATTYLVRTAK